MVNAATRSDIAETELIFSYSFSTCAAAFTRSSAGEPPTKIESKELGGVLEARLRENPKIATLIKIDREAKYQKLVDIIDELNLVLGRLGSSEKRFSIVTFDSTDMPLIGSM